MANPPERRSGAIFSSRKCPPAIGLDQSVELPFGFVWTPFGEAAADANNSSTTTVSINRDLPPVLCVTCLSYMNLYCETLEHNNTWICPFCKCENGRQLSSAENDVDNIANTVLVSPTLEFRQPLLPHSVKQQQQPDDALTMIFVLDTNLPATEAHAVGSMLQKLLLQEDTKRRPTIHLGLVLFGKNVSVYQLGVASGMALADVVSSHEGLTTERLQQRAYLTEASNVDALLNCIAAQFGVDESSSSSSSSETAASATETATTPKQSRLQMLKERKEARLRAREQEQERSSSNNNNSRNTKPSNNHHLPTSPWTAARARAAANQPPYRCTGEALQCAIDLVTSSTAAAAGSTPSRTARILLFTNGCPNIGDGSVVAGVDDDDDVTVAVKPAQRYSTVDTVKLARASEYFELVAKTAAEGGIGMDVFCTGTSELGLPVYQSVVEPSSGYVLSHDSFVGPHLAHNVAFVLQRTYLSLAQFPVDDDDNNEKEDVDENANPAAAAAATGQQQGEWIEGCTVDIRMSW